MLFSTSVNPENKHSYDIPGVSSDIMSLIIQYAYGRPVLISKENVSELLLAADQFLVSGLIEVCCEFLEAQLCSENCVGICGFTERFHSCSELHHKAKLFILRHFEEVLLVSEEFLELSLEQLKEITDKDELNVKQEKVVFEAVLRWISHAPENRRQHIAVLLPKVRQIHHVSHSFLCINSYLCLYFRNAKHDNNHLYFKIRYNSLRYTTYREKMI